MAEHEQTPHVRSAQRRFASELTELVHGADARDAAVAASEVVFGGGAVADLEASVFGVLVGELPTTSGDRALLDGGAPTQLLVDAEVVSSKSEATRLIKQNGVSINDRKLTPEDSIGTDRLLHGRFLVIR